MSLFGFKKNRGSILRLKDKASIIFKKMESYKHGNCLCYIYVHYCSAMYCTTMLVSATVLKSFRNHTLPCICVDIFP